MKSPTKQSKSAPRKTLAAGKEMSILTAAHGHFLRHGFAGASMDALASSAGVSVKTIYSHFDNKEALFNKAMVAACTDHLLTGQLPSDEELRARFPWFAQPTQRGLMEAGKTYLDHLLSEEQLALYRVVTQDAARFPELGRQYQKNFVRGRTGILTAYLNNLAHQKNWKRRDALLDAKLYEALLRGGIFEEALQGLLAVTDVTIETHARSASKRMWAFLSVETN
jgi:AcrR family transcriptional regulator